MNRNAGKYNLVWMVGGMAAAVIGYVAFIRPRHLRWGTIRDEAIRPLPGDDLVPDAGAIVTHAITIRAPQDCVWPWIAQIGQDKGGFYSYTFLENLLGCDMHNTHEIRPEWQSIGQGDGILFHPKFPPVPVALLEKNEYMVTGADLNGPNACSWAFVLRDLGYGQTRLIVRLRARTHKGIGRLGDIFITEPAHFVMERKMMLTIKALAEERVIGAN